ncbi:MAG: hypothetical protein A3G18_04825 [Rhodospirillales bacterium RIFCSPLOWO2_12_FULL_58_28]|nr:MAG: hypothetical protein A3H92_03930 [Rhodospirillales bacterium RIFCSPLOWO2_02_FULL_58_16]OHC79527.1 MAG: hypothetical protein A3G18_04825 [Rhodospirillales bacterium RIFCSPLOWO2_12_FULL_58_28]
MILGGISGTPALDDASKAKAAQAKLDDDMNRFLKLLVTQLKNQDPLKPMDATEFTSQLVQFASVEQQISANANLEKLLGLQQTSQVSDMVNFIGNTIEADAKVVPLENGKAEFTYDLDTKSDKTAILIKNSAGLNVFSTDGENGAGKHNYVWDGKTTSGSVAPDGSYTVVVTAVDRAGEVLGVKQTVFGRVTGAGAENGIVSLFMGDSSVTMDKVQAVKETKKADVIP